MHEETNYASFPFCDRTISSQTHIYFHSNLRHSYAILFTEQCLKRRNKKILRD